MNVTPIRLMTISGAPPLSLPNATLPANEGGFGSLIRDAVTHLNELQREANEVSEQLAAGQSTDLHKALVTVEEASLALELALQIRNKVVESYQEIMRMQV